MLLAVGIVSACTILACDRCAGLFRVAATAAVAMLRKARATGRLWASLRMSFDI